MGIGAKRVDYHAAERKRILCTVSPVRSFHRGRERGALCWFRLHKGGLNPFKGTKSAHREARSKGNLPVKHGHWATPMDTTNQALEGIKGQNVGNVFGGLCIGKCTATGKRRGGGGPTGTYHQQSVPLLPRPWRGHNPRLRASPCPAW